MDFEIIDFHTHPYLNPQDCISIHGNAIKKSVDETTRIMQNNGVSKFCGSVLAHIVDFNEQTVWNVLKRYNDDALTLKDYYKGAYVAGFHVHPKFVEESIKEIDRFYDNGVNLIGELVPWRYCFDNSYNGDGMHEILDYATEKGMVLSAHPTSDEDMDLLCKNHPNLIIVGAHPGEGTQFHKHVERAKSIKTITLTYLVVVFTVTVQRETLLTLLALKRLFLVQIILYLIFNYTLTALKMTSF